MRIQVEEQALGELKSALTTSGETYKKNLAKLTRLMNEITKGDIKGDVADEILNKYKAKIDAFKKLEEQIDRAQDYAGVKQKSFVATMEDIKQETK